AAQTPWLTSTSDFLPPPGRRWHKKAVDGLSILPVPYANEVRCPRRIHSASLSSGAGPFLERTRLRGVSHGLDRKKNTRVLALPHLARRGRSKSEPHAIPVDHSVVRRVRRRPRLCRDKLPACGSASR